MTFFEMLNRLVGGSLPKELTDKSAQSKFFYANALNRDIVEQRISDLGAYTGSTKSQIIEDTLIGSLLPKTGSSAAKYVNQVLFGRRYVITGRTNKLEEEPYGIREGLIDIFRNNSNGLSEALHDNLKPLVKFTCDLLPSHHVGFIADSSVIPTRKHVQKKYGQWLEFLAQAKHPLLNAQDAERLGAEFKEAEIRAVEEQMAAVKEATKNDPYHHQLGSQSPEIYPFNYVRNILDEWDICKGSKWTYEFLAEFLETLEPWGDSADERIEFQRLCEQVMDSWDATEEPRSPEGVEARRVSFDERN